MIKNCLVCKKELHKTKKRGKDSSPKKRIGKNQITCGRDCGKIYDRIARYIYARINRQKLILKNTGR